MSPAEALKIAILEKVGEIDQLRAALRILDPDLNRSLTPVIVSTPPAQSEPAPAPLPAVNPVQTRVEAPSTAVQAIAPKPAAYIGPRCGACQSKMYQTAKIMPSGAYVSLWKCNDSGCGNEIYN